MITARKKSLMLSFVVTCFLVILSMGIASAHGLEPVSTLPAEGEVLQESPDEVRLVFEEEISEAGSTLQVFDNQGKSVDLGGGGVDLNDANHASLVVKLPPLSEGLFLVKWQVTLLDGDASQGNYYFGIGNVTVPQAVLESSEPEIQSRPTIVIWAILAAGIILIASITIFIIRTRTSQ